MSDKDKSLVANFFGAPGSGKSLSMADVYQKIKKQGYSVEMVPEYAKELVWDDNIEALQDQEAIFTEQNRRIQRLDGKVDIILVDSPVLLSKVYYKVRDVQMSKEDTTEFFADILKAHNSYANINFFLLLLDDIEYEQEGRVDTHEESLIIENHIVQTLVSNRVVHYMTTSLRTDYMSRAILNKFDELEKHNSRFNKK